MKTLIINGSPRKNGDSKYIIDELSKELKGEKIIINVFSEKIKPCIDCRYCWTNSGCIINDKMQDIYKLLDEVDNVILSSPIYFSELTGELLSFASRFQVYFIERTRKKDVEFKMKSKLGALILTAGGDTSEMSRPIRTANIIFGHINTKSVGVISSVSTDDIKAENDMTISKQILEIALKLNR